MEEFGPVQIMVVGFEDPNFTGEILEELRRLSESDLVRVVDLVAVMKDDEGDIVSVELSDLSDEERMQFGAVAGALIGLGMEGDEEGMEAGAIAGAEAAAEGDFLGEDAMWSIADSIPNGSAAAVALFEHRWAIPLRGAIIRAGGMPIVDTWVHPQDLVAIGAAVAAD
jgi:uncharacterized membrane protein